MENAQQWLAKKYESQKNTITEIKIEKGEELQGELTIDGYPKLEKIFLGGAKGITKLKISGCLAVKLLFVSENQLTEIEGLEGLLDLEKLSIGDNKVEKIDLSKNKKLQMLYFRNNPLNLEFVNGLNGLTNLVSWDSYETFPLTKILDQTSEEELKEIAKELGLDVNQKKLEDIKKDIKDEVEKIKQNKQKIDKDLPGLFDVDGKVDDNKLKEIKDGFEDGAKYQKLVVDPNNTSVVDSNKKEIDQGKLTDALKELGQLHDVPNHNDNGRILDNGKFSQSKLDDELVKGSDYDKLVKDNPDLVGKDGKIDPARIKDLSDKGKNFEKLEDTMKKAGIDPSNADEAKKTIERLNALKERVEELFGKDYEKRLEVPEYQATIVVNTVKN